VTEGWNAFAYIYNGTGQLSGTKARRGHALVLGPGGHITASTNSSSGLRFLLLAGQPIGEPIQQYGPFVMNTMDEIHQAYADFQTGRLQNPDDDPWVDDHQDL
jgi:redox-sensitive bicupin YhaK (pirin superfamily)